MQKSIQQMRSLALRHLSTKIVEIIEQNQLVLWDSEGVFVVKTPENNLSAHALGRVGLEMQDRAKKYLAVLSRKILGRKDEKQALKNMASYLALRRIRLIKRKNRAKAVYLSINHT